MMRIAFTIAHTLWQGNPFAVTFLIFIAFAFIVWCIREAYLLRKEGKPDARYF